MGPRQSGVDDGRERTKKNATITSAQTHVRSMHHGSSLHALIKWIFKESPQLCVRRVETA